jgi:hypothetical protein
MKTTIVGVLFCCLLALLHAEPSLAAEGETDPLLAAESFLQALDAGDYEKSWRMTSPLLQARAPRDAFELAVGPVRSSFGPALGRAIKYQRHLDTASALPDGTYLYVVYESSFEKKNNSNERVIVHLEADGCWRVCEYLIF